MLVACWSVKGGSGTTVVTAGLAVLLARDGTPAAGGSGTGAPGAAVAVDLAGDLPAVLGLPDPGGPGVAEWLSAGPDVDADALAALEVDAGRGLRLLPRGDGRLPDDGDRLAAALAGPRHVVVDCGSTGEAAGLAVAAAASLSLLVLRPCYLALRRAVAAPLRPSGVILIAEGGRALGRQDIEHALGVPVRAEVAWDPAVARCVDAGLLAGRVPRTLERALRRAS
ncbi:MAG TPA: hypothetical protein VM264_07485 [Acidimicrobiales bacterium]|nr:hypothetical protein [Acidimicrobiales bacterium]